ncbi:hypothetical protein [Photobacterium kishitanii]|nr:hypothetical protein [Photobacterium kishitanii]
MTTSLQRVMAWFASSTELAVVATLLATSLAVEAISFMAVATCF